MDKLTEQSEKHISSSDLTAVFPYPNITPAAWLTLLHLLDASLQSTVYFSVTNKHPALRPQGSFCDWIARSALEAHQLNLPYKTLTCVLLFLQQGIRNGCWSSQRQQKGFSSSGVTQQTLLLGDTARLTVQELFLQHSPKIVALAQ